MRMRRRGPGLVGTAARTAVIAGTATAVSGKVAQAQHAKAMEAQAQAPPPEPPPAAPAAATGGGIDLDQLERLAALHAQGVLDDAEFAAAKQRIITGA
jgi:hypothetical protein